MFRITARREQTSPNCMVTDCAVSATTPAWVAVSRMIAGPAAPQMSATLPVCDADDLRNNSGDVFHAGGEQRQASV
ncbi:hypothetical protein MMON_56290 [Mycolicibacterium monacense]|uniref:Uncharacterized protein n=1 Tax=Mycolicibacterium monacense TaxID=85693 RepID=A0AAD1N0C3_MYCMB|nr:hypothetical protein MMON_56290 [Mycolicibacterium monacense]